MMKKSFRSILCILLSFILCVSLCSCTDHSDDVFENGEEFVSDKDKSRDEPSGNVVKGKRNIIIDSDSGADDASAIILAALQEDINIVGVTIQVGNVDLDQGVRNVQTALELAGCDAPVYKGAENKFDRSGKEASSVFGDDGMGDAGLVHSEGDAAEGDAVDFILNTVKNNPGEIEIVALGSVTNIADAIDKDPEVMKDVKQIWSMGTAGFGPGNATPVAEFNVYVDAEAYSEMLDSELPITIIGLDMCDGEAQWTDEQFDELSEQGEIGGFVTKSFGEIREFYRDNGSDTVMNCDALAMMCVVHPDFINETINTHASCVCEKGETYGEVIFYKEGFTYDLVDSDFDYNVKLVTDVDKKSFFSNYLDALNNVKVEDEEETEASDNTDVVENGDVYVLFTSDVHCGIDKGFGYAGLQAIKEKLESEGNKIILVDDGDSIQGDSIGTLTKGDAIIDLMNALHYDVAIPGNHEFDYGMDTFLALTEKAEFPYISCNFNKNGKLVFDPYIIKEVNGIKIAFVGVTTPATMTSSSPVHFQNDKGEFIYGFMQDDDGTSLYAAVQDAVDDARAEGADLVYVMAHTGNEAECEPWTYADIISNTNGIDVYLDGHSHDTDQIVMQNKDGVDVTRSAVGKNLNSIGYSHISAEGEVLETGIWSWTNDIDLQSVFPVENEISVKVRETEEKIDEVRNEVIATSDVDLVIYDPVEKDLSGNPLRISRVSETNSGDFCADALRYQGDADVGIINGGSIRDGIEKGDVTYGDIIDVQPYGNELCVIRVTGQQLMDALEWGARSLPGESGSFLQVSGISFEIDTSIDSSCTEDENSMFTGVSGERRVQNVMVGDEPIDPEKEYTLAGFNYILEDDGDGYTMFDDCEVVMDKVKLDNQVLMDYINDTLGGKIGNEYADMNGQGRIVIKE